MCIPTPHITGSNPHRASGIIRGSRGNTQQLLRHIMLLIHQRVRNVELVGICITYYLLKFVLILYLPRAISIYTTCKRVTDMALSRLRPLHVYTSI